MSRELTNPKIPTVLVVMAIFGLVGCGVWFVVARKSSESAERKVAFYQDSMHPWIKSDQPGKCTICGMDLTPIYEGDGGLGVDANMVVLSPSSISVMNVKTEEVKRQPLRRTLRVAGTLDIDETHRAIISAPAVSRIDSLNVAYTGVEVQKGQPLVTIFSPELVQKGRVLLAAAALAQGGSNADVSAAVQKANPFSAVLASPISGTVTERLVADGQYVSEGERLLTIVDASVLWFRFDVYEQQLPWCQLGQKIDVVVPAVPGKIFPAVIEFIEPTVSEATRTVKVRANLQNPAITINGRSQRVLRFGMYAEGCVSNETPDVVSVPRTAILSPGGSAYTYVDKGSGAYEMRRVKLGRQGDEYWEVLHGLEEGDRVVTSGNVLIDAQAQFSQGNEPGTEQADNDDMHDSVSEQGADAMTVSSGEPQMGSKPLTESRPAVGTAEMPAATPGPSPAAEQMTSMAGHSPPTSMPAGGGSVANQRPRTRVQKLEAFRAEQDIQRAMRQAALAKAHGLAMPDATLLTPSVQPTTPPETLDTGNPPTTMPAAADEMHDGASQASPTTEHMPPTTAPSRALAQLAGTGPLPYQRALRFSQVVDPLRAQQEVLQAMQEAAKANDQQMPDATGHTPSVQPTTPAAGSRADHPSVTMPASGPSEPSRVMPSREPEAARRGMTASQRQALKDFTTEAAAISKALAADDVGQFNQHMARLPVVLPALQKALSGSGRWEPIMKRLTVLGSDPKPAKDLAAAREQFLAFSTATVELVKQLRKEDAAFAELKVYHCPMAPKPGLWMQAQGPLRNPFYGSKMLTCGTEVKP